MSSYAYAEAGPSYSFDIERARAFFVRNRDRIARAGAKAGDFAGDMFDGIDGRLRKIGVTTRGAAVTVLAALVASTAFMSQERNTLDPVLVEPAPRASLSNGYTAPPPPVEIDRSSVVSFSSVSEAARTARPVRRTRVAATLPEYAPSENDAASAFFIDSGNGYNLTYAQNGELVRVYATGTVESASESERATFIAPELPESTW